MSEKLNSRYGVDPYLDWVAKEGIKVTEDYGIDLFTVETSPWPRFGVKGAAVHLIGRGDFTNMFLLDIPPGGSTTPQRHLYEDVYYVLEGTGSHAGRVRRTAPSAASNGAPRACSPFR